MAWHDAATDAVVAEGEVLGVAVAGTPVALPITTRVRSFPTRVVEGRIEVEV